MGFKNCNDIIKAMITEVKQGYFPYSINSTFITKKVFFFFWIPIPFSTYKKFSDWFQSQGKLVDPNIGMLEKPKFIGFGFLGFSDSSGDTKISGDFIAYNMIGDYKQFKSAWKKIMTDYPNITEAYHLYLTDPRKTKLEENKTYIIFR